MMSSGTSLGIALVAGGGRKAGGWAEGDPRIRGSDDGDPRILNPYFIGGCEAYRGGGGGGCG